MVTVTFFDINNKYVCQKVYSREPAFPLVVDGKTYYSSEFERDGDKILISAYEKVC